MGNAISSGDEERASAHFPSQTRHLRGSKIYYMHDSIIDHGATSIVYRGFFGDISTKSAVKRLNSQHFLIYENELKIWKELQSERSTENVFVVNLYDWTSQTVEQDKIYYFCMERAKCNLDQRIKQITNTSQEHTNAKQYITTMLHQAAQGLSWLHKRNIIHRDIKPHNILIFDTISGEIAKIGDFGISRIMSTLNTGTITSPCGTFGWMAPETLIAMNSEQPYTTTKAVDIFSFGMTCQYCYSHCISGKGSHPFVKSDRYKFNIAMNIEDEHVRPVLLDDPTPDHLFQWMMRKLPKDRPQISQVLEHPFFWDSKKSLSFLVDIAKCIDLNTDEMKMFRKEIDDEVNKEMSVDWKSNLDEPVLMLIVQRKSKPGKSFDNVYDTKSVTSLLKLIRDKYVHHEDLVDELINDNYFGAVYDNNENFTFSEEKYARYFSSRFQDVLMLLYKYIGNQDTCGSNTGCLTSLVNKYNVLNHCDVNVNSNVVNCRRQSQEVKRYMDDDKLIEFLNSRMPIDEDCHVIKPTMPMEFLNDFYCLPKGAKGHALILNNFDFTSEDLTKRRGSEKETFYMSQLWGELGYTLTVLTNFTRKELDETIDSFKAKLSADDASLIVYVGSHGELNTIYTTDSVPVSIYRDIIYKFDSQNCPELEGKPKIFITQFDQTLTNIRFETDEFSLKNAGGHMDDAVVCFATIPGTFSFRNTVKGGLFTYCLTKVFMEHAHRLDLITMLKKVQTLLRGIKLELPPPNPNVRMLCSYQDLGIKTLYFNMEHE